MTESAEMTSNTVEEIFEKIKVFFEQAGEDDKYEVKCKNCTLHFYRLRNTDAKLGVYLSDYVDPDPFRMGWSQFDSSVVIDMIPFMLEEFRELRNTDLPMVWDAWFVVSANYPKCK